MRFFLSVRDLPPLSALREEAYRLKKNPFLHTLVGKYQTLGLLSFEQDLHTQLALQKAAQQLGMHVIQIDLRREGKKIIVGNQGNYVKTENLKETAQTIGAYCEMLAVYAPVNWHSKTKDPYFGEELLMYLQEFAEVPVINLESPSQKPLEALAQWLSVEEYKKKEKIKIALTWIPHKKPTSQANANSFVELFKQIPEVELAVAHPPNYRLLDPFLSGIKSSYHPDKALENADFVLALNWASTKNTGKAECKDPAWQLTADKMHLTQRAALLHCQPALSEMGLEEGLLQKPYSLFRAQAHNRVLAAQLILKEILLTERGVK